MRVTARVIHNNPESDPDFPPLMIIGDRQAGKTHAAMLLALCQAALGDRVLYSCYDFKYAAWCTSTAAHLAKVLGLRTTRISQANGRPGIYFMSGGVIDFRGTTRQTPPLNAYDLQVVDDYRDEPITRCAKRVVKTVGTW